MSERWEIDVMRNALAFSALLIAAACTSGNQLSQNAAHIPQPEITIIGRTDLTNVPTRRLGRRSAFRVPHRESGRRPDHAPPHRSRQPRRRRHRASSPRTGQFNTVIEPHTRAIGRLHDHRVHQRSEQLQRTFARSDPRRRALRLAAKAACRKSCSSRCGRKVRTEEPVGW